MNKKTIWITVIVVALLALAIPRMLQSGKNQGPRPGGAPGGKGQAVPVSVMVLSPQKLVERIVVPGTILADESVEIKSETSGRISVLNIREGGRIAKGELIAKINDADLQAQLAKASAVLRLAQERETRQKGLLDKQVVSSDDYQSAGKDLESAQADAALLKAQIDKTEMRAPFDGRLGLRYVSPGAFVAAGTKITTVVRDRPLKAEFSVSERYLGRVKVGAAVELALQSRSYTGTVYAMDPSVNEETRTFTVRARCTNPDSAIAPGMFVEVALTLGENDQALLVPTAAIVPTATGQTVYSVKGGSAIAIPVLLGVRDSINVQVVSGLQPGDTVVTTGVLLLRPGVQVDTRKPGEAGTDRSSSDTKPGPKKKSKG